MGGLRCRVWAGSPVLRHVVTHDPQRAGGDDYWCGDRYRLETVRGWACTKSFGFIFGSIGIVVFSLLGKAPSASMQKRFAEADAHYHTAPPTKLQAE